MNGGDLIDWRIMTTGKIAIVTGSNKGIGFAIAKELSKKFDGTVYVTARDEERGKAACSCCSCVQLCGFVLDR
ncbi:unnamed protein product, partial [Allacma fusca]